MSERTVIMSQEHYDALAARLAEAVRWKEDAVIMCAKRQCATRDKRLTEAEARAEAAGVCVTCGSKGFAKSKTGTGCEFCDGTVGGVGP